MWCKCWGQRTEITQGEVLHMCNYCGTWASLWHFGVCVRRCGWWSLMQGLADQAASHCLCTNHNFLLREEHFMCITACCRGIWRALEGEHCALSCQLVSSSGSRLVWHCQSIIGRSIKVPLETVNNIKLRKGFEHLKLFGSWIFFVVLKVCQLPKD